MKIIEYLQQQHLTKADFARSFTPPVTPGLVWQWIAWQENPARKGCTRVTAERAIELERMTNGALNRKELRPDLFAEGVA